VISKLLGLSENLAGVTLLAFGNGSPDLFTSLSNISKDDTELMYTQLIGGATFVTGFVIGIIMIIQPCRIPPRTYVRDVLFFLTAAIFISSSTHDQGYTLIEGILTVSIYFLFLSTVIIDHLYMKRQMKHIREHKDQRPTEERQELEKKAEDLESILEFQIRSRKNSSIIINDEEIVERIIVPAKLTVGANKFLWKKFVESITPISKNNWIKSNWFERVYMILQVN
jgi:sodium/potassium/calcium exchanger 6